MGSFSLPTPSDGKSDIASLENNQFITRPSLEEKKGNSSSFHSWEVTPSSSSSVLAIPAIPSLPSNVHFQTMENGGGCCCCCWCSRPRDSPLDLAVVRNDNAPASSEVESKTPLYASFSNEKHGIGQRQSRRDGEHKNNVNNPAADSNGSNETGMTSMNDYDLQNESSHCRSYKALNRGEEEEEDADIFDKDGKVICCQSPLLCPGKQQPWHHFHGKAKFRDSQPTLVSKRDFELVHKTLTLQQQKSDESNSTEKTYIPTDLVETLDCCSAEGTSSMYSPGLDTASVTSDFIAWLDTPLASASGSIPPVLTFASEEKGQPVTVAFYHDPPSQFLDNQPLENSSTTMVQNQILAPKYATALSHQEFAVNRIPTTTLQRSSSAAFSSTNSDINPCISTSKVTLKFSAGVCLLRKRRKETVVTPEVLVIRRSSEQFYELPKGHLEKGENLMQAAYRELVEETGIKSAIEIGSPLLSERYVVRKSSSERLEKSVHYFRAKLLDESADAEVMFGEREEETKELKWMRLEEAMKALWKSNAVRSVVIMALTDCDI